MNNRIKAVFIYWEDAEKRKQICSELGLPTYSTVNGKTMLTSITQEQYDILVRLAEKNILRLTLKP